MFACKIDIYARYGSLLIMGTDGPALQHRVFWDMDNMRVNKSTAPNAMLARLRGDASSSVSLYCNRATLEACRPAIEQLCLEPLVALRTVSSHRQAADLAITADMIAFARRHGCAGDVTLVSSDSGFAATLSYCRSLGCHTTCICAGRRYQGKGRSSRWSRQPLVLCADVALGWDELLDDLPTC